MLYGDPTEVLREGSEILQLTNDEEDPRGMYGVRKHSIIPDQDNEGLRSRGRGVLYIFRFHLFLETCFLFVAARPAVSPVLEDDELDEVPNTLLLEPSHVDTMSVASYHTALTHDKEFEHPAKVKKRRFDRVDS